MALPGPSRLRPPPVTSSSSPGPGLPRAARTSAPCLRPPDHAGQVAAILWPGPSLHCPFVLPPCSSARLCTSTCPVRRSSCAREEIPHQGCVLPTGPAPQPAARSSWLPPPLLSIHSRPHSFPQQMALLLAHTGNGGAQMPWALHPVPTHACSLCDVHCVHPAMLCYCAPSFLLAAAGLWSHLTDWEPEAQWPAPGSTA